MSEDAKPINARELAGLIVGMVRRGAQTKASGICRAAGPMVSFEEWAADLIAAAMQEAEKRGAESEQARIFHTDSFGSGSTITPKASA